MIYFLFAWNFFFFSLLTCSVIPEAASSSLAHSKGNLYILENSNSGLLADSGTTCIFTGKKKKNKRGCTWKQKCPFVEILEEKKILRRKNIISKFPIVKNGKYNLNIAEVLWSALPCWKHMSVRKSALYLVSGMPGYQIHGKDIARDFWHDLGLSLLSGSIFTAESLWEMFKSKQTRILQ